MAARQRHHAIGGMVEMPVDPVVRARQPDLVVAFEAHELGVGLGDLMGRVRVEVLVERGETEGVLRRDLPQRKSSQMGPSYHQCPKSSASNGTVKSGGRPGVAPMRQSAGPGFDEVGGVELGFGTRPLGL